MRKRREKELYPIVERWLKRNYFCFDTCINTGLKYSRMDVIGIRDIGGELSGEVESIIVEVKNGSQPFATACGQTLGYRVYGNRIYLADYRERRFSLDEISIASHLGIGLIRIYRDKCQEILSSPFYQPIKKLNLNLYEKMSLGWCRLCGSLFKIEEQKRSFSRLARENIDRAILKQRGLIFWNREVAERKNRLGVRESKDGSTYERRFVCPDCVQYLIAQFRK